MGDICFRPVTGVIGAEVEGVELTRPLAAEQVETLRGALNHYQVLVFRDQPLTPQQQYDFAANFGPIAAGKVDGEEPPVPGITVVNSANAKKFTDQWHSDHTFVDHPPMAAMLHAVTVPRIGGDTLWANMAAAYDALSPAMQGLVDGLTAIHSTDGMLSRFNAAGMKFAYSIDSHSTVHPVVRVHPETGRKILFINAFFVSRIVELGEAEGRAVLQFLYQHMQSVDFQMRVRWAPHTSVLWDERSTHHFAMPDYDEPRILNRLMIDGSRPVGTREVRLAA